MNRQTATFAAGCFWGVEADFRDLPGVLTTEVGYTGGTTETPTYEEVCRGATGHAEAVRVEFDADAVAYPALVERFWGFHDPTQRNRQGPDVGTQYRTAIFVHDEAQRAAAEASKASAAARFSRPIVTEIVPAGAFYPAEDYHQRYLEKRGLRTCRI